MIYSEALQEILTKIEERAPQVRAFCPGCGHMNMMRYFIDSLDYQVYQCDSCSEGFIVNHEGHNELEEYNKMRFEHV